MPTQRPGSKDGGSYGNGDGNGEPPAAVRDLADGPEAVEIQSPVPGDKIIVVIEAGTGPDCSPQRQWAELRGFMDAHRIPYADQPRPVSEPVVPKARDRLVRYRMVVIPEHAHVHALAWLRTGYGQVTLYLERDRITGRQRAAAARLALRLLRVPRQVPAELPEDPRPSPGRS